jgi:SAM-dependent methyltransferase
MFKKAIFYLSNPGYIVYRFKSFLKNDIKNVKFKDDFDWDLYTIHYKAELEQMKSENLSIIKKNDYSFINNKLICNISNGLVLHTNHHVLYETLLVLNPKNIIEIGCGGGDHLRNISTLNNQIVLNAIDRSTNQIELLKQRHPNLNVNIKVQNITDEYDISYKYDISYSQAVIMHIKDGHMQALENMFNVANNQVVLMENWLEHDFYDDIQMLFTQKRINWDSLYLYINNYQSSNILIASKAKLTFFKELTSKSELL